MPEVYKCPFCEHRANTAEDIDDHVFIEHDDE